MPSWCMVAVRLDATKVHAAAMGAETHLLSSAALTGARHCWTGPAGKQLSLLGLPAAVRWTRRADGLHALGKLLLV